MTITVPGYTTITGNPVTILHLMQAARIFDELKGDEYIKKVQEDAHRAFDIDLKVTGDTLAERAESLLREMAKNDMITIEEEAK